MRKSLKKNFLIIPVLVLAVFLSYGSRFSEEFSYTERALAVNSPLVRAPLTSFLPFEQDILNSGFRYSSYYRPLQMLSYALNFRSFGPSPFNYRIFNVVVHYINALLVFFLAFKISEDKITAGITSLLFVVHPFQMAAVPFITFRSELLCTLFGLCYIAALFPGKKVKPTLVPGFLSVIFLFLAFLSNENAAALPLAVFILHLTYRGKKMNLYGLFAGTVLAAAYLVCRVIFMDVAYRGVYRSSNFIDMLSHYGFVLQSSLVGAFLPFRPAAGADLANTFFPGYFFTVLILSVIFLSKGNRRELSAGIGFFAAALIPGALGAWEDSFHMYRFSYFAYFGLFLFISASLRAFFKNKKPYISIRHLVVFFLILPFCAGWFFNTPGDINDGPIAREMDFSDKKTALLLRVSRYQDPLETDGGYGQKNSEMVRIYLSEILFDNALKFYLKGRLFLSGGETAEAERYFRASLRADPACDKAYMGMAYVSFIKDDNPQGLALMNNALRLNGGNAEVLIFLSKYWLLSNDHALALYYAEKAIDASPYDHDTLMLAGEVYISSGNIQKGAEKYFMASILYPEMPGPSAALADLFYEVGDAERGEHWAKKAAAAKAPSL